MHRRVQIEGSDLEAERGLHFLPQSEEGLPELHSPKIPEREK